MNTPSEVSFNAFHEDPDTRENKLRVITLTEGKPLHTFEGGPTDEGYDHTSTTYLLTEGVVTRSTANESRDCDGRLDSYQEAMCPVEKLASLEHDGNLFPSWVQNSHEVRDHSAEAMGY